MWMKLISNSVKQTQAIAEKLAKYLKPGDSLALVGNLGAGKTVFVKGLALGLGGREGEVVSPTFVLLRQYRAKTALNHFDLYRLKDIRELERIGYEEYFDADAVTAIEWADRIEGALPREYLRIELSILGENRRRIRFIAKGEHYADNLRKFKRQAHTFS